MIESGQSVGVVAAQEDTITCAGHMQFDESAKTTTTLSHEVPMKRAFAVAAPLLSLMFAACAAAPKVDLAAEETAVRAAIDKINTAERAKDADQASGFYTADAHVAPANEPAVDGADAVKAMYTRYFGMGFSDINSSIEHVEVAASGDLAYAYGKNTYTIVQADGSKWNGVGKYVAVMKKVDGAWKAAALSFSDDAPPPAAPPAPAAPAAH